MIKISQFQQPSRQIPPDFDVFYARITTPVFIDMCMLLDAQNAAIQQRTDYSSSARVEACMLNASWKGAQHCGTRAATERHMTLIYYCKHYPTLLPSSMYPESRNVVLLLSIDGIRDGTLTPLALDGRQGTPALKTVQYILSLGRS